uniref:Disease resistance protein At4g27190-like leucine-rich repeats domain-containing protein n=2 Tax=Chenopodium quinoa TaxID=63459 RepID=A0A803MC12_CHEQI
METFLPCLVSIKLSSLHELQHLPSMSQLCHLKSLQLWNMPMVEHIESDAPSASVSKATKPMMTFFPSLEELVLVEMPQLKGWRRNLLWKEMEAGGGCLINDRGSQEQAVILPSFPRLRDLSIGYCNSMTYFPPCPLLKKLELWVVNEALTFCMKGGFHPSPIKSTTVSTSPSSSSSSVPCSLRAPILCLEKLNIDNPTIFNSLFEEFVLGAVHIQIEDFAQVESMWTVRKGFRGCESSIRHLKLESCSELTTLSGSGIEHLYNLQSLSIERCDNLDLEGMPWCDNLDYWGVPCISLDSLSSLRLAELPKLLNLPWRFQYLTSLQSLQIESCGNLEALGDCIGSLCSLRSLQIKNCYNLKALPECMDSLKSLELLHISHCHELKSLPEAMCHLTSLITLKILYARDDLEKRCLQPDGEDWPKIRHIPHVYVIGWTRRAFIYDMFGEV